MASKRNRFTNLPAQFFNWINSHIESAMTSISNYFVTTNFHTVYKKMPCDLKNVNTMAVTRCTSFQEPSYQIFSSRELQVVSFRLRSILLRGLQLQTKDFSSNIALN